MYSYTDFDTFIDNLNLDVGQTYRGDCPSCAGRNTFTCTNDQGNIIYNCYKNTCRVVGTKHVNMEAFTIKTLLNHNQNAIDYDYDNVFNEHWNPPSFVTKTFNEKLISSYVQKYGIDKTDILYDLRDDRIVFPIYVRGSLVDGVGRSVDNKQPKWLRYASSPVPYTKGNGKVGVLVEDAISAYVVNKKFSGVTGIAILGTQLTDFHKWYIPQIVDTLIVSLDPDARLKEIDIKIEMSQYIDDTFALNASDDLKYANEEDITELGGIINEFTRAQFS